MSTKTTKSAAKIDKGTNYAIVYTTDTINTKLSTKQDKLVSGTNIKTINNTSILGSGNITVTASVPGEVAKITGSSASYCNIERNNASNYAIKVCHGVVSINANEVINKSVTFSSAFSGTPSVTITATINDTTDTRQVYIELTSVTPSGFKFSVACGNTAYKIVNIHYIAVYTK